MARDAERAITRARTFPLVFELDGEEGEERHK